MGVEGNPRLLTRRVDAGCLRKPQCSLTCVILDDDGRSRYALAPVFVSDSGTSVAAAADGAHRAEPCREASLVRPSAGGGAGIASAGAAAASSRAYSRRR